jgi:predicted RecB family nuclease
MSNQLHCIYGIGPVAENKFNQRGIYTVEQLYNSDEFNTLSQNIQNYVQHVLYPPLDLFNVTNGNSFSTIQIPKYSNDNFIVDFEMNSAGRIFCVCAKSLDSTIEYSDKLTNISDEAEIDFIIKFRTFIGDKTMIHYGHADKTTLARRMNKLKLPLTMPNNFDLHQFLCKNDMLIKGCNNRKLKEIGNALVKEGYLPSQIHNHIEDGKELVQLFMSYEQHPDMYLQELHTRMESILQYNMDDVELTRVLFNIVVTFLKIKKQLN